MVAAACFSFSASSDETIVASIPLIFPLVLPDDDGRWASSRNAFVMSKLGAGVSTAIAGTSRRATVDTRAPDSTLRRERIGGTGRREHQVAMKCTKTIDIIARFSLRVAALRVARTLPPRGLVRARDAGSALDGSMLCSALDGLGGSTLGSALDSLGGSTLGSALEGARAPQKL